MSDIAQVLTGVAVLEVGVPVGSRAEWSDEQAMTGNHSIKLSKLGGGNYGSTHGQFNPVGAGAALTLTEFIAQAAAWSWDHYRVGPVGTYWEQMELRFEDPLSESWVDVTVQVDVAALGGASWDTRLLLTTDQCFYGGWSEQDGSFANWTPGDISLVTDGTHLTAAAPVGPSAQIVATGAITGWLLTRVRMELWETSTVHYVYLDNVYLEGQLYTLEPGATVPIGLVLSAPFTEVGYTEDGVIATYTAETSDIEVEEETVAIDRVLTKEIFEVTCNMAQSSLFNMDKAMAGSVLSGNILKLGAGVNKKITLQIRGTSPDGFIRSILIPSCTAMGAVGMAYTKDAKTVIPVTFQALKTTGNPAVSIVDNEA